MSCFEWDKNQIQRIFYVSLIRIISAIKSNWLLCKTSAIVESENSKIGITLWASDFMVSGIFLFSKKKIYRKIDVRMFLILWIFVWRDLKQKFMEKPQYKILHNLRQKSKFSYLDEMGKLKKHITKVLNMFYKRIFPYYWNENWKYINYII